MNVPRNLLSASAVLSAVILLICTTASGHAALTTAPTTPDAGSGLLQEPRDQGEFRAQGAPLSGGDIKNLDSGMLFATIQLAIDDALTDNGDVLEVQVASHSEGIVTVTKELTIRGMAGGSTILATTNTTTSGDGRGWFLVTSPNLTVEDLTFDGNGFLIWQGFRIKAGADDAVFDNCTFTDITYQTSGSPYSGNAIVAIDVNMSVTDCAFSDIGRHGIFFFGTGVTAGVASGNTYTGKGAGDWLDYGVEVGGGAVATLSDNTITDCRGVAVTDGSTSAAVLASTFFGAGTSAALSGNFLNGNTGAVADGYDSADVTVLAASDNDLSGNDTYTIQNTSATVTADASGNWWGSNDGPTVAATTFGDVDYTPWLDAGTDVGGDPSDGFQGDFSVLNVDDDSPQSGAAGRIQEGVLLVMGSTVNILPGTNVEQIIIDGNDVTLQGDGASTTFIHSPATLATAFTTSGPNKPIIAAMNSGDIRIEDVTVDGLGLGNANNRFEGVAFWNAGGALLDAAVTGIRDTPASGVQHGVAVYSLNDTGGPYALEVGNVVCTDYQKNAMALSGDGMTVNVHGCTTTGAGDISYTAQNGIQVSFGAGGAVTDCTIEDVRYLPATFVASGLLTYAAATVTVSGTNLITDCQAPVSWYDTPGICGGCEIPSGGDFDAIFVYNSTTPLVPGHALPQPMMEAYAPGHGDESTPFAVSVAGGCLTGTGASGTAGIYAYAPSEPLNLGVSNMMISGWDYGVYLDGAGVNCTANDNSVSGNTTAALDNSSSGNAVDAEFNWWGDASGPSGEGPGTGDDVLVGAYPGSVDFAPWLTDGTSSTACAFTSSADNTTTPDASAVTCISTVTPCVTVPFEIDRGDIADMRAFSVTFTLSSELMLCSGLGSIDEGTYLNGIGPTHFEILDNTGGSYTVDCAILGLPCGQTADTGTLFTVDVKAAGGDGTGTLTVTAVDFRDCGNGGLPAAAGPAAAITVDATPPVAVADLSATQKKTLNDADGTTKIDLAFSAPGDAATVEVYRAPFGYYPEYDDDGGAEPAAPSYPPPAPWALTAVTTSPDTDEPARDFWYYVVFTKDACGNVSAVSNKTGGTLSYHLGDISPSGPPGDNSVGTADISGLSATYGKNHGDGGYNNHADVGPTDDDSVDGLPETDNAVQFEDLLMFAINFGQVSIPYVVGTAADLSGERPELVLLTEGSARPGGLLEAKLVLQGNRALVKGIHAVVAFDRASLELLEVSEGDLIGAQGAPVFFKDLEADAGRVVDLAALGRGVALEGSGEVAVLRFRSLDGGVPVLAEVDLRDAVNGRIGAGERIASRGAARLDEPAQAARLAFLGARPNPFGQETSLAFELPAATAVRLQIFDVTGRLVRTLASGEMGAGRHGIVWDGRSDEGRRLGGGIYLYSFQAGRLESTGKIFRLK